MNTPINFELSTVLKQKGFDIPVRYYYLKDMIVYEGFDDDYWGDNRIVNWNKDTIGIKPFYEFTSAPTIIEVVMWLYEKHGIWISISSCMNVESDFRKVKKGTFSFSYTLNQTTEKEYIKHFNKSIIWNSGYKSPIKAYEVAIEYTLNNLI